MNVICLMLCGPRCRTFSGTLNKAKHLWMRLGIPLL